MALGFEELQQHLKDYPLALDAERLGGLAQRIAHGYAAELLETASLHNVNPALLAALAAAEGILRPGGQAQSAPSQPAPPQSPPSSTWTPQS